MLENYNIRTDLALETRERFVSDHVEIPGVSVEETYDEEREIRTTRVVVETENGAKMMGKPVGTYLTIEAPNMAVPDEDYHREISKKLAEDIKELVPERKEEVSVLVVGLGNREVTPDALGPYVADHLHVTRHIVKRIWEICDGKRSSISCQCCSARGYGADWNGDAGDCEGGCGGNGAGFCCGDRCACGEKQ